jgi:hypothetical protein
MKDANTNPNEKLDKSHPLREQIQIQPEELAEDWQVDAAYEARFELTEDYEPNPYDGTFSEM